MAQYSNEHLTTAQISAYLDKELAADELLLCHTHLQSCQDCQGLLTDFRLTSSLLRGMPQIDIPRSFVLPLNIAILPQTPGDIALPRTTRRTSQGQYLLGHSLRILSTLAAVLGLVFILTAAISSLPQGTILSGSTTTAGVARPSSAQDTPTLGIYKSPNPQASRQILVTSTPESIATVSNQINQILPSTPPALLDPGQPLGRLGIGSLLFLLGILGVVLTRRFRSGKTHA